MCEVRKAADDAWLDQYYQLEAYYLKHDPGYPYNLITSAAERCVSEGHEWATVVLTRH